MPAEPADDGLINAETAARLLMIEPREIERLSRKHWFSPERRNPARYRLVAVVQGYLKYLEHERTRGWTVAECAADLEINVRRFMELVEIGAIERASGTSGYDIRKVRGQYRKRLSEQAAGRGDGAGSSLVAERARLAREQSDAIAMKNAIARGDFVPLGMVLKALQGTITVIREQLPTIPGKIADACAMRTREEIEEMLRDEIAEALNELAEPAAYCGVRAVDPDRSGPNGPDVQGTAPAQPH
jgi:phage terminase Nu1 subunit (DNA packaging protein)